MLCRYEINRRPLAIRMSYNIDWILPSLRNPTKFWNIASTITMAAVDERPKNVPLITVSNHHSCFDDPGLWGSLKLKHLLNKDKMRWSLAAHDICFTCAQHSYFFAFGKCVPIIRGAGVFQNAVDFCIEQLNKGSWVHVFPEGKVNMTKENMRLKWGVGRMIFESLVTPIVIPIWHIGMDDVLPNEPPYYLRLFKKLTLNFGNPIDFSELEARASRRNTEKEKSSGAAACALRPRSGKRQTKGNLRQETYKGNLLQWTDRGYLRQETVKRNMRQETVK
ncbi:putative transferase, partial [Trypoxylus dichotomus]